MDWCRLKDGEAEAWPPKFAKLQVEFDDGTQLAVTNIRRLGRIGLKQDPANEPPVSLLGWDPLQQFPLPEIAAALKTRSAPVCLCHFQSDCGIVNCCRVQIKAALLDQTITAGVGNWIADECLYQSRLHPTTPCNALTDDQIALLHQKILDVRFDWRLQNTK